MPEQTEWLTVEEAARWLAVSPVTVYRLVHDGVIQSRKVGRACRIKVNNLKAHVAAHRIERSTLGHSLQGGERVPVGRHR